MVVTVSFRQDKRVSVDTQAVWLTPGSRGDFFFRLGDFDLLMYKWRFSSIYTGFQVHNTGSSNQPSILKYKLP